MNDDKWLNDIRNKIADFETEEPDGLWSQLEARQHATIIPPTRKRRGIILTWLAAAALLTAVMVTGFYLSREGGRTDSAPSFAVSTTHEMTAPELPAQLSPTISDLKNTQASVMAHHRGSPTAGPASSEATAHDAIPDTNPTAKGPETQESFVAAATNENEKSGQKADNTAKQQPTDNRHLTGKTEKHILTPKSATAGKRFSVGVFTSGAVGNTTESEGRTINKTFGNLWFDDPASDSENKHQILSAASGISSNNYNKLRMQHHQPIRFGLSVSYVIAPRLNVESGISYSRLSSDVTGETTNSTYTGEQTLHYLGVPLNLRYRLASWRSFDFYASAGGLAEKCVAGKISGHETTNGKPAVKKTADIHENQWQFSLNAAAGVQFCMTDELGIYVEPGISYYIDNGSNLNSIYKDRPLNFNLNIGLRLSLGR